MPVGRAGRIAGGVIVAIAVALALLAVSLLARVLLEVEPANFHVWLGTAAGSFAVSAAMFAALARG